MCLGKNRKAQFYTPICFYYSQFRLKFSALKRKTKREKEKGDEEEE